MMTRYIKADLYYFFHSKIKIMAFVLISILLAICFGYSINWTGWQYLRQITSSNTTRLRYVYLLIIISGVLVGGFFKNKMESYQQINLKKKYLPGLSFCLSTAVIIFLLLTPSVVMFVVACLKNNVGSYDDIPEWNTFMILLVYIVVCMHINIIISWISWILKNEIIGTILVCVYEIIQYIIFTGASIKIISNNGNRILYTLIWYIPPISAVGSVYDSVRFNRTYASMILLISAVSFVLDVFVLYIISKIKEKTK